ncbi:MAG: hypothetical protein FJW09_03285 [Actinobacteria bacterium]|nr:hypothetical protein [Actinomycetota bacterium]
MDRRSLRLLVAIMAIVAACGSDTADTSGPAGTAGAPGTTGLVAGPDTAVPTGDSLLIDPTTDVVSSGRPVVLWFWAPG